MFVVEMVAWVVVDPVGVVIKKASSVVVAAVVVMGSEIMMI